VLFYVVALCLLVDGQLLSRGIHYLHVSSRDNFDPEIFGSMFLQNPDINVLPKLHGTKHMTKL
jgi:hypothetical protein